MRACIGLTGNMGCGKSKVAELLSTLPRVRTLSSDDLAKEIVFEERHASSVRSILGLAADATLTRKGIADIIFANANARRMLEQFVASYLQKKIATLCTDTGPNDLVVIESALLYEHGELDRYDAVVVAVCAENEQHRRLISNRGMTQRDIDARLALQLPQKELAKRADFIIDTNCSIEELLRRVKKLYDTLITIKGGTKWK